MKALAIALLVVTLGAGGLYVGLHEAGYSLVKADPYPDATRVCQAPILAQPILAILRAKLGALPQSSTIATDAVPYWKSMTGAPAPHDHDAIICTLPITTHRYNPVAVNGKVTFDETTESTTRYLASHVGDFSVPRPLGVDIGRAGAVTVAELP